MHTPTLDPTPIFEQFRGSYATELLTAAVAEFRVFDKLKDGSKSVDALRLELGLAQRPAVVLFTALKAMGLLREESGTISLTPMAREHLLPGGDFFVGDYVGLASGSPGVREMVERLKTNRPAGADKADGAAFIFKEGMESAMEKEASARQLTLALAGRAKNVAPHLAAKLDLSNANCLLDVGGGTGIYAIACLQRNPHLKAIVMDRPEVLKIAREFGKQHGVLDRLQLLPGDMFADPLPAGCDVALLSNILHDWDVPECKMLVRKCAAVGKLVIHDVFLNDALDGPLPTALYSAALFTLTEGRAYSAAEHRGWMAEAGLKPGEVIPTLIHCGMLIGTQ